MLAAHGLEAAVAAAGLLPTDALILHENGYDDVRSVRAAQFVELRATGLPAIVSPQRWVAHGRVAFPIALY